MSEYVNSIRISNPTIKATARWGRTDTASPTMISEYKTAVDMMSPFEMRLNVGLTVNSVEKASNTVRNRRNKMASRAIQCA